MHTLIEGLVDAESFFEVKPLFAPELIVGLGLLEGRPVGIVANNPMALGGTLFVDSADKASRFILWCDAFNVPLVFLADVPGFMIGTEVERQGIIRHGAKMVTAVSEATVPKVSVIVRKAYGAGLYAMSGPAFEPEATIALPTAKIAVMGPEAAVNAVFANKIAAIDDPDERAAFVAEQREPLRSGRRPLPPGVGDGDRRRDRLPRPPPRDRPPPGHGPGQGSPLQRSPPRRSPGLRGGLAATGDQRHAVRVDLPPLPAAAVIRDVGPRDGLQPEAPVAIEDRVRLIEALVAAGVTRIEAVAFVSPSRPCPPWRAPRRSWPRSRGRRRSGTQPWCPTCVARSWRSNATSTS